MQQICQPIWLKHYSFVSTINSSTQLSFDFPEETLATLTFYNLIGRDDRSLVDRWWAPGRGTVDWTGVTSYRFPVNPGVDMHNGLQPTQNWGCVESPS